MIAADVSNKTILITGAGSGIGAETTRLLAERGATLFLADINESAVKDLSDSIVALGGRAGYCKVDVSSAASVAAMFEKAGDSFGKLDVVINNAGIDHTPTPMHQIDNEVFDRNIAVNLAGVWYCMKQAIESMLQQGGGHIINVASVAGLRSSPMISAYSAAKHGVIGLTRSAAVEYARNNIRVNAVCPSFVKTPMVQNVLDQLDERRAAALVKANPMKRLGQPEEIAAALAWLCSDESSFMTGQQVVLDGGMLA